MLRTWDSSANEESAKQRKRPDGHSCRLRPVYRFNVLFHKNAEKLKFVFREGDWEAGVSNIKLYP